MLEALQHKLGASDVGLDYPIPLLFPNRTKRRIWNWSLNRAATCPSCSLDLTAQVG